MSAELDTTKTFVYAFTNEVIGNPPSGFTDVGANNDYSVESMENWYGDRCLRIEGQGSIAHNWSYTTPSNISNGDYEITGLFRFDTYAGDRVGLVFRAHNDSGDHKCYAVILRNGDTLRLSKFTNTSETTIDTQAIASISTDTWYWIKVLVNGSSIKAKHWAIDEDEPSSWTIDTTDSDFGNANVGIGIYGYIGSSNVCWVDYLKAYIKPSLPYPSPVGPDEERANVWHTWKETFVRWDGAIEKFTDRDVVSEGQGYGLMMAAQVNDQATFNLIENFCYGVMERTNEEETLGHHMMCWKIDYELHGTNISDTSWATDADIDRAWALLWAHSRWGSGGSINYLNRAQNIIKDIREDSSNTDEGNVFILPYEGLQGDSSYRINPSYLSPAAFRLFKQYDTGYESFWDSAISGSYKIVEDNTDNVAPLATTAGLPSEWVIYNSITNEVESSAGDDEYGFNAFRVLYKIYWDYYFYGSPDASDWLSDQIDDFFNDEYDINGDIDAGYDHDGSNPVGYDLSYFYWAAYYALYVAGQPMASSVKSNELDNAYTDDGEDAYYYSSGYYSGVWNFLGVLWDDGELKNYGQLETTTIQKSLEYQVRIAPSATPKSLEYQILTQPTIQKFLSYLVTVTPFETKILEYRIEVSHLIGKGLEYIILATPPAITKSLTYQVQTTPSPQTKSLQYAILTDSVIQKNLTYDVVSGVAIQKSLQYTIEVTPSAITKSLQYSVETSQSVTKSLDYAVLTSTALQKSLQYGVVTDTAIQKSLQYTVEFIPSPITKFLQYTVRVTLSGITKGLRYSVQTTPTAFMRSLMYKVATQPLIQKGLKYTLVITPTAPVKSLGYSVTTSIPVQKILEYVIKSLPMAMGGHKTNLRSFDRGDVAHSREESSLSPKYEYGVKLRHKAHKSTMR